MKKNKLLKIGIIGLSLVTLNATNIKQVQDVSKYPISSDLISVSRGGTLPDKKAITDGIGTVLIGSLNLSEKSYSNKSFNKALFNHRNEIIDNDKSLETLITDGIVVIPNNQLDKINNRNILVDITNSSNIPNGTSCNDNNPQTINDIYTNNVCTGTNVENQSCDDNNLQTINDIYTNGVCTGTNVEGQSCTINGMVNTTYHNGTCQGGNLVGDTCDDNNVETINDVWLSGGTCAGTNVEGQSCDDNNLQTTNDTYHNGVCSGTNNEGQSCNDGNNQTINDVYHDGICEGTNVEGQSCTKSGYVNTIYHNGICGSGNGIGSSCDDGNVQTINDKWLSDGTCQGTNVEGQSCDDNNNQTTNDIYISGVCIGTPIISIIGDDTSGRTWSDNTVAISCNEYKNDLPDTIHKYQGDIGNGIYKINPDGTPFNVYCDMETDNGGWTVVANQNLYVEGYPTANNGIPNLNPNDVKNTRLTTWPLYTEYALKTVIDLHGAPSDDSVIPLFTKDNTGIFGKVNIDMMSFFLNKTNYQNGKAKDDYVMYNGVAWGDSNPNEHYFGYRWFNTQNVTYNWWGQADIWGHLIDSDLFRIASTVTGYARTGSCGYYWAQNDCRLAKTAWVYRNTIKQKAVFMVK